MTSHIHNAVLQRLDHSLRNDGIITTYPKSAFENVSYDGIPVIYCEGGAHPAPQAVTSGNLPAGYKIVGSVSGTRLSNYGEPRMIADLNIYDEAISERATAGELCLSTALDAKLAKTDYGRTITGGVVPDHVLLFPRTVNAYPNDAGAYICNMRAVDEAPANSLRETTEEDKGMSILKNSNPEDLGEAANDIADYTEQETVSEPTAGYAALSNEELTAMLEELKRKAAEIEAEITSRTKTVETPADEVSADGGAALTNSALAKRNAALVAENARLRQMNVRLANAANRPAEGYTYPPSNEVSAAPTALEQRGIKISVGKR